MPAAMIQFVFKPNPGADLAQFKALLGEAAAMWRQHGAQVSLWAVQVGEIGNMAFIARCDSSAKLGEVVEAINTDPHFAAWRAKNLQSGLSTWVRSNQAYEVPI